MKYVGARYMPEFVGTYDPTTDYEALSVVDNGMGTSYVSNKPVPAGTPLSDTNYWAVYGSTNGAIINLQDQINALKERSLKNTIDIKFNAARTDSFKGYANAIKYNNIYIGVVENTSTFDVELLDASQNLILSASFNEQIHPNSIFVRNNVIYIVDSSNNAVYKINFSTLALIEKNTTLSSYFISGAYDYDGKIYFRGYIGSDYACIVTDYDFNIERTFIINHPEEPLNYVRQSFVIYDNVLYLVSNRPNALTAFDLEGNYLGVKYVGEGNGYYPYCEIQNFYVDTDNNIYMATLAYNFIHGTLYERSFIFRTDFTKDVLNDNSYGQAAIGANTLKVNSASTATNPDGLTNAFNSLYEASIVADYLSRCYSYFYGLELTGDFSNDVLIISGTNISVYAYANVNVGLIGLYGASTELANITTDFMIVSTGELTLHKSIIKEIDAVYAKITSDVSEIQKGSIYSCIMKGAYNNSPSSMTITNSSIEFIRGNIGGLANATKTITLSEYAKAAIKDTNRLTQLTFTFLPTRGGIVKNPEAIYELTTGDKTSIAGGTPVECILAFMSYDSSQFVFYEFKCEISSSSITLTPLNATFLDGTSDNFGGLYYGVMAIKQI